MINGWLHFSEMKRILPQIAKNQDVWKLKTTYIITLRIWIHSETATTFVSTFRHHPRAMHTQPINNNDALNVQISLWGLPHFLQAQIINI